MKAKNHCEVFGTLEKLEEFTSIKNNIIPGSLVFESLAPFWGYYSDFPGEFSPMYIYIGLDKVYPAFDITRAATKVREDLNMEFDVAKAFVTFNDRSYNVMRIRHLEGYDRFQDIQEAFARQGIKPAMVNSTWNKITVHVTLKKVFCLSTISDGIYADACEKNHFYLEIPKTLTFDEFVDVTTKVRHNWLGTKFDVALGAYILAHKVKEIVRVYSEKVTEEDLFEIQKLYNQKIK